MTTDVPDFDLKIKNYRCFSDHRPVHIAMRKGFTALIGVNNSGKSALLEFLFDLRDIFGQMANNSNLWVNALRPGNSFNFAKAISIRDASELFCNANSRDMTIELSISKELNQDCNAYLPDRIVLTIANRTNTCMPQIVLNGEILEIAPDVGISSNGTNIYNISDIRVDFSGYIRAFRALHDTMYIGPFRNAINVGGKKDYFDITIGQQFIESWLALKTGDNTKDNKLVLDLTDDIAKIFRFNRLEINASQDKSTLKVFIDGKTYRLDELGSGLAQFIIVLGNVAQKKPSWVLIDEPELNLHPSLQIDFLTTLTNYSSYGILFSTHNIGLARACAERIYSFRLDDNQLSEVRDLEAIQNLSEFLGELSFSGYRELGFDKVLLVEGPTDVRTVQQFLRKYRKDHEILLLPLGGSSLINATSEAELEEIKRITNNVYALIDSEKKYANAPIQKKRQSFIGICDKVGIKCHILQYRAIENYFTDRAVKAVKGENYSALQPYDKLADAYPGWGKSENWRIAREMSIKEIKQTDIGEFIDSL